MNIEQTFDQKKLINQVEKNILSSLIFSSDHLVGVFDLSKLKIDYFNEEITKKIFSAWNYLYINNKKINATTIHDTLQEFANDPEESRQIITYLYNLKPDGEYCLINQDFEILQNHYIKTSLNKFCQLIINSEITQKNFFEKIHDWRKDFLNIISTKDFNNYLTSEEVIENYKNLIDLISKNNNSNKYLKTGYSELDKKIKGLIGGQLLIIAARPGIGKTAFAINILSNNLHNITKISDTSEKQPAIGFFSLEMKNSCIVERLISLVSKLKLKEVKKPLEGISLSEFNKKIHEKAQNQIANSNILFCDYANVTITEITSLIKLWVHKYNLKFVIIDYLQLINITNSRETSTWSQNQKISTISRALKLISIDLDISIVALAQLNRKSEERKGDDKEPLLSDLRESGSIEQDADIVTFLYEDKKNQDKEQSQDYNISKINLKIGKNRHGEIGLISFIFDKSQGLFKTEIYPYNEQ